MSVSIRKNAEGLLIARMESPPEFYCLACEDVTIEGFTMRIWHYLVSMSDRAPFIVWVFNRITMTVLTRTDRVDGPAIGGPTVNENRTDTTSVRIFHDQPHLLLVPNIGRGEAFHTNLEGTCFTGSNTFDGGKLCLGDSFGPYDFSAVHLLCNYNANADLGWRGEGLQIQTPIANNQRIVTSWPTLPNSRQAVPQQLTEFFKHS